MLSLFMIVVTLGFITGVSMETCPEAEDIYPCRCKEDRYGIIRVECSNALFNNLENRLQLKLLQQALSSLRGKKIDKLILQDFSIRIPSKFFAGLSIKNLQFHSCLVDFLTNDDQPGLLGLENHLEVLLIKKSSTIPPKLNLGHLKKLRDLRLFNNNMTELRDDWLSGGISSLEYLLIIGNNIIKIGSNAFSQLSNLKTLWLDDNRFGDIQRSMLPTTADRLQELYLFNNGLTSLPVDLFSGMSSVRIVSLSRNGLTTLDERTWSPVWQQLQFVSLDGAYIFDNSYMPSTTILLEISPASQEKLAAIIRGCRSDFLWIDEKAKSSTCGSAYISDLNDFTKKDHLHPWKKLLN